jgi:probable rRNA maturation factor
MTVHIEWETADPFDFGCEEVVRSVAAEVLDEADCPYEAEISVLFVDNTLIRELNEQHRQINQPTDVLSFPMILYKVPADFSGLEEQTEDFFDPDTGELLLGDIVVSVEKVMEQAARYGHSPKRELAFLIAHSMYHLLGYDHVDPEEAAIMEQKQEEVLAHLNITREN